ncbi:pentapeptide repeat-containing protein [Leucobacter japonicus]|uniref:pentapeptide repeat-containing protein n=1 Tax=Leucobacter japonicus TaxID=1461259 RepID=UPI0006A77D5C|nr:pentapeptide repeat-containing protein [Leucobacter japonicus]
MPPRTRNAFQAPQLDDLRLNGLENGGVEMLAPRGVYELQRFDTVDISGLSLAGAQFTECAFEAVQAHEADLQSTRFIDSRFEHLTAPVLSMRRTTWKGVELSTSRLGAVEAYDAEFSRVRIDGSKLGWLNFRAAKLHDVQFVNCHIDELDLEGAELVRVAFDNCTVDKLVLTGARSQHLDLRGLDFASIAGIDGLRGARISTHQATDLLDIFASQLGIEIA